MAIEFIDDIRSPEGMNIYLLEDLYLKGGYRVLATEADKDAINPTTCKEGMLVKCADSGYFYSLKRSVAGVDDFGDPTVTNEWELFTHTITGTAVVPLCRNNHSIGTTPLRSGEEYEIVLNTVGLAYAIAGMRVDAPCTVQIRETSTPIVVSDFPSFNQSAKYIFDKDHLFMDLSFKFPDGTKLSTRSTPCFINKDPAKNSNIYVTITNTGTTTVPLHVTLYFTRLSST